MVLLIETFFLSQILLEQPFRRRRALLREQLPPFNPGQNGIARFDHVESCESEDGREGIETFWVKAVESRCEGLMIKVCLISRNCEASLFSVISSSSTAGTCWRNLPHRRTNLEGNRCPLHMNQVSHPCDSGTSINRSINQTSGLLPG